MFSAFPCSRRFERGFLSTGISPSFGNVVFPQEIGGLLYEANQANQTKIDHFDQVARTDEAGKVIARSSYSAYGQHHFESDFSQFASDGSVLLGSCISA